MFVEQHLSRIIGLHEKSYALLRWIKSSLRTGQVSFGVVHHATDSAAAAQEWINRHLANIPEDARPEPADVPVFARLFASFLTTSFQLNPNSVKRVSACGCYCQFCCYLQAGPNLDPRTPSKKHFQTAVELKRIYLTRLASEVTSQPAGAIVEVVLFRDDLREQIAMATWGAEVLRRSEFASQGEAVLALWREFAWNNDRPKRDFRITARAVCDAGAGSARRCLPASQKDHSRNRSVESDMRVRLSQQQRAAARLLWLSVVTACVAATGCSGGQNVTTENLESARQLWAKAAISDYDLEYTTAPANGHYLVTVRGGEVKTLENVQPGGAERRFIPVPPGITVSKEFSPRSPTSWHSSRSPTHSSNPRARRSS